MFALTKNNILLVMERAKEMMAKVDLAKLPLASLHRDDAEVVARHVGAMHAAALLRLPPELCPPVFVHWEDTQSLRIRYYDSERALIAGRTTTTTLGRWLNGMKVLDSVDRAVDHVRSVVTTGDVKFAVTAKEIELVYANGPSSCMSEYKGYYRIGDARTPFSVPSVYAYPHDRTEIVPDSGNSLAVAYLGSIDGNVVARAVCDMKNMTFNRIYGDIPRMFRSLRKLGYKQNKDLLLNVPLTKIVDSSRNKVLCPYLDAKVTYFVNVFDSHIALHPDGAYRFCTEKYLIKEREVDDEGNNDDNDE